MRSLSDIYFPAIPPVPTPLYGLLFVIAYFACAFLGVYLSITPLNFVNFWLPGGLLVGALLRLPTRNWTVVAALALLANGIFNTLNHQSIALSMAFAIGNVLAGVVAASLIRRFTNDTPRVDSVREVSIMVLVILMAALISSAIAYLAIAIVTEHASSLYGWLFWWSGDALGMLLLVPLMLAPSVSLRTRWQNSSWQRHVELLALFAAASMMAMISFGQNSFNSEFGAAYLVIACMLWSATRFDLQVTSVITLLITVLIVMDNKQTAIDVPIELVRQHAVLLQMLVMTSVLLGLFLSALLEERRLQSQRLREKNFLFAESQRIAQIGTWNWKPSSDDITWSEETYHIFGVEPQSFKPTISSLISLVHPDDRQSMQTWLENCRINGKGPELQFRSITPAGELRMLRGQGEWQGVAGLYDGRMVGTVQNITEPVRTLSALRDTEHKLESVFRHLPVWISIRNLNDSTYIEVNEQALNDLGYSRDEIVGRTASKINFMSSEDRARVQEIIARDGRFSGMEVTINAKDGRKLRALANGEKISLGGQPCILVVAIDISARRQMEEKLLEQSAQLKLFIECSPVALAMFDRNMCYLQASNRWKETFVLSDADIIGQSHYKIFPDIPDYWKEVHQRGMRGEIIKSDEDRYLRRSGNEQWVRWEVRPWYQADGKVGGIVIFTEDITERKQAGTALVEHEAMLNQMGELARVGVAVEDLRAGKHYWSSTLFSIHEIEDGIPPTTEQRFQYFPEEVRPTIIRAVRAMQEHGASFDLELPFTTAKHNSIWLRIQGKAIVEDGKTVKLLSAYQDITVRKRAELELRNSEERFRTLVNNLQVGVVVQGPQAEVVWCNQMALELLGLTRDQLLGKTSFDKDWNLIREDGSRIEGYEQPGPQVIATGKAIRGLVLSVYRPLTKSWVWLQVDAEPEFNEDGSFKQVICSFGDITARKQAEIDLRESEERFRQIAENIHEVFWVLDVESRTVIYVSPAYEKIWGRQINDVYKNPRDWINAVVVEDRQRVIAALDKIPTAGQYQETYRITRPDGQIRWIRDQGFGVYDLDGELLRVVGTAQDITEAREIENQLRRSQRLESIGTLTGGIAHDFNNILAGILGFTALADQTIEQPNINRSELKTYLGHIGRAGKRAADLIAQILTFSRSDSPAFNMIKMDDLVGEAVKLLRAAVPSSIEFETHIPETPAILGNASQLHQVIMNLGTNAWHAMRGGKGRLSIILDSLTIDDVQARMLSNVIPGEYVRLRVVDTGSGMTAETQERIFEPFYTTKPAGQGTGLGLSVVHGIVRSHRGAIRVNSELGHGTTFEIFLPVNKETAALNDGDSIQSAPRGHGQRILLVDDESALVMLGEHSLKRYGYVVTGETKVSAALKRIEQNPGDYDLVVTDQTMPGMTGVEFAARVHALRPTLPVVLVSGHTGALSAEEIKRAGIVEVLEKPYTNEILAATIHRQFVNRE